MSFRKLTILLGTCLLILGGLAACSDDDDDTNNNNAQAECPNGVREGAEECDGDDLGENDCTTVAGGFTGGSLACDNTCHFDTTGCVTTCGDGDIDTGEDCDGDELGGATCANIGQGFYDGTLDCTATCTFDTSGCNLPSGPSQQIEVVRNTPDGTGLSMPIEGAWVTYLKPEVGDDSAGFFLQAEQTGPAIFVAVDPGGLTPSPAEGDEVDLTVVGVETVDGQSRVTAITGLTVVSTGHDVSTLVQDVNQAADLQSELDDYESELITVDATLVTDFGFAGQAHLAAEIDTEAVIGNTDLRLRIPEALNATLGLGAGCEVTVTQTPLWRFNDVAQVSAWYASEITVNSCPEPEVLGAVATGDSTVVVTFSRAMDQASISNPATQFTFDLGLTASDAVVNGTEITLTTSVQTPDATYLLTVATSVTDTLGTGVSSTANTAEFTGFNPPPTALFFSEYVEGSSVNKALEIYNHGATTADLTLCEIHLSVNGGTTDRYFPLAGETIASDDVLVVCDDGADAAILANCDVELNGNLWNGDDAIELTCGGVVLDVIGQVGFDPGSAWSSGGVSTENQTLRRKCSVTAGDPDGSDAFDPSVEWDSFAQDTFDGLGEHCP